MNARSSGRYSRLLSLLLISAAIDGGSVTRAGADDPLPVEPVEIGTGPQFVFDNYVIDNHWASKLTSEAFQRVAAPAVKHQANPLFTSEGGYVCVRRDPDSGKLRMWYQTAIIGDPKNGVPTEYGVAYAESDDGLTWRLPELDLFPWKGHPTSNIVWRGIDGRRASGPFILDVPEPDRRGYRFVMLYHGRKGMGLVGSQDGIHWDRGGHQVIAHLHSDTHNNLLYDPRRDEYVLFCRPKHIFRTFQGDVLDTGESRRIARMASRELWTEWQSEPQTILVPDELDTDAGFHRFYGMVAQHYGGVYWGLLWPFRKNDDIHTELAFSRDGFQFERLPDRPRVIGCGPAGAWDDGMVFGCAPWVEMGDEWWIYYAGADGPHESRERSTRIGVATIRKEGLVAMQAPERGGVLVTRKLVWPGGDLVVNVAAHAGEFKVRVSDERRRVIEGFDYDDCETFSGDSTGHIVAWTGRRIADLAGQTIRLEFFLRKGSMYTFRALGAAGRAESSER